MGNTYSIPPFPALSAEQKSSAASSRRFNQRFLKNPECPAFWGGARHPKGSLLPFCTHWRIIKATPHNGNCGLRRIFCPIMRCCHRVCRCTATCGTPANSALPLGELPQAERVSSVGAWNRKTTHFYRLAGIPGNPFSCYNDSVDAYTISACPGGPATGSAFGQERRRKPHETEKNSVLYDGAAAGSHHAPDGFCGNL